MGDPDEHIQYYASKIDTAWIKEPMPMQVVRALLVSGDRDLFSDEISLLKSKFGASAGDWESGAIAWVTLRNHTKCLILRGVTDLVSKMGGEAYGGNVSYYYDNTELVMKELIESLPRWLISYKRTHSNHSLE